jgi:hypothetical protein
MATQTVGTRATLWSNLQIMTTAHVLNLYSTGALVTSRVIVEHVWRCCGVNRPEFGGVGGTGGQGLHMAHPTVLNLRNDPQGFGLDQIWYVVGYYMADGDSAGTKFAQGFGHDDSAGGDGKWAVPDIHMITKISEICAALGANYIYSKMKWDGKQERHVHMTEIHMARSWLLTNLIIHPIGHCQVNPVNILMRMIGFNNFIGYGPDRNPSPFFHYAVMNAFTPRMNLMLLRGFLEGDGCSRMGWSQFFENLFCHLRFFHALHNCFSTNSMGSIM